MIFKTFDSDSDKVTSKIGVLNRSFLEWGNTIDKVKSKQFELFKDGAYGDSTLSVVKSYKDAIKEVTTQTDLSKKLVVTKADIEPKLKDLSVYDNFDASKAVYKLQSIQKQVDQGKNSWFDYFDAMDKKHPELAWQKQFVKDGKLVIQSTQDVADAQKAAKSDAIAYNKGLEHLTIGAKATNAALKALSVAANIGLGILISMGVSALTKGIDELVHAQENLIEKAEEANSQFKEQRDLLSSNKKTIEEISDDYVKLSQGVDNLGQNVSLNTDEYARYNKIVNQIAEMFPQMVQGYTDEGNAIITHKGQVEELTQAYKDQKDAAQAALIVQSADVFKGYREKVNADGSNLFKQSGLKYKKQAAQAYYDAINSEHWGQVEALDYAMSGTTVGAALEDLRKEIDLAFIDKDTDKDIVETTKTRLLSAIQTIDAEIRAETAKIKPIMQAYMEQSYDFQSLDDNVRDVVSQIVSQFDSEFYSQFDNESEMAADITKNIVSKFKGTNGKKIADSFINTLNLKTKLQNGEIPIAKYLSVVQSFKTLIDGFDDHTKKSVELLFSVDGNNTNSIDIMLKNVKDKLQDKYDDKVSELTLSELQIASDKITVSDGVLLSWGELIEKVKKLQKVSIDYSYTTLNEQLDDIQKAYDATASAIEEFNTTGYISVDTFQELISISPQYLSYLINEKGQLALNTQSLKELTKARIDELAVAQAKILIDDLSSKSQEDQIALLKAQADATDDVTNSVWNSVIAYAAESNISGEALELLKERLKVMVGLAESAKRGIDEGGLAKSQKDSAKQLVDAWESEYLARLEHDLELHQQILDKYAKQLESIDFDISLFDENDYTATRKYYEEQVRTIKNYGLALKAEFDRVASLPYSTGDEAQAIADKLTSLGEAIRSNAKSYVDASSAMFNAHLNSITSNAETAQETLDRVYDYIERRKNVNDFDDIYSRQSEGIISSLLGDLDELYAFENGLFATGTETAVDKKRKENEELINLEREMQDTIHKIVSDAKELQYKKNAEERKKERARLQVATGQAVADIQSGLDKVSGSATETGNDVVTAFENAFNSAVNASNSATNTIKSNLEYIGATAENTARQIEDVQKALQAGYNSDYTPIGMQNGAYTENGKRLLDYASSFEGSSVKNGKITNTYGNTNNIENTTKWCAEFISDMARAVGIDSNTIPQTASVQAMLDFFKNEENNGQYYSSSDSNFVPQIGDIAIRKNTNANASDFGSHVGIVAGITDDGKIITLEGNTSGKVKYRTMSRSSWTGFGRPDYSRYEEGGRIVKKDEPVLVGEKGRELGLLPNGGAIVLGENGAEMVSLPVGTEVLPNDKAEDILGKNTIVSEDGKKSYSADFGAKLSNGYIEYADYMNGDYLKAKASSISLQSYKKTKSVKESIANGTLDSYYENAALTKIQQEIATAQATMARETVDFYDALLKQYDNAVDLGLIAYDEETHNSLIKALQDATTATEDYAQQVEDVTKASHEYYKGYMENQINDIEHGRQLRRNTLYGDDITQSILNSDIVDLEKEQELLHQRAEGVREYMRSQGFTEEEIENSSEIQELQQAWWDKQNEIYEVYNEAIDKAIKGMERQIATLQYEYDQENLIISALEKKYDLNRQLRESQREINAELEASKDIIAIAGDDGTLFNQDDWNLLNSELKSIKAEIDDVYSEYTEAISNLSEAEWYKQEEITNEFERQTEALMQQYEIAKQELEVSRQQTKMQNIANEKNKRMLIGGKWVNTPDLQALYEARKELATLEDEEYELRREAAETKEINSLNRLNDSVNTERLAIENRIDMINDMTSAERKALAKELLKVEDMDDILSDLRSNTLPNFKDVIDEVINNLGELSNIDVNVEVDYSSGSHGGSDSPDVSYTNEYGDKVDVITYADLPRYHTGKTGIGSEEELAIIKKDETILTPVKMNALAQKLQSTAEFLSLVDALPRVNPMINMPKMANNGATTSNTFTGDIIVKEPVQDMAGFLNSVVTQAEQYYIRTKNK